MTKICQKNSKKRDKKKVLGISDGYTRIRDDHDLFGITGVDMRTYQEETGIVLGTMVFGIATLIVMLGSCSDIRH
jgi:hypothetical protein